MKPEYVEEMKKLGVPWFCNQSEGIWSESGDFSIPIFTPETDSVEILEFATLAANEYHALKSAVEELRKQLLFTAKYLREIGYTSREESEWCRCGLKSGGAEAREMGFLECKPSLFPAAEYADSVADGIDHVLKQTEELV
jgi:hypothetical protein